MEWKGMIIVDNEFHESEAVSNELPPKSWTKNFWGAVQNLNYDTASP